MSDPKQPNSAGEDPQNSLSVETLEQLYQTQGDQPPEALDREILALAKAHHDQPGRATLESTNRSHRPKLNWLGGLATAAVALLSVTVLYSGFISDADLATSPQDSVEIPRQVVTEKRLDEQAEPVIKPSKERYADLPNLSDAIEADTVNAPAPRNVAVAKSAIEQEAVVGKAESDDTTNALGLPLMRVAAKPPAPTEAVMEEEIQQALNHFDESEKSRQKRSAQQAGAMRMLRSAQTSTVAVPETPACDGFSLGVCEAAGVKYARHPNCASDFSIPLNALSAKPLLEAVIYEFEGQWRQIECISNAWVNSPFDAVEVNSPEDEQ